LDQLSFTPIEQTLRRALEEDLGHGDLTSLLVVPEGLVGRARVLAKEDFVLAGMPFMAMVFSIVDPEVILEVLRPEGSSVRSGDVLATISGPARSLLAGERTSLNILQRVSGIATLTRAYADRVRDLPVRITDTRKTTPGLRLLEKYAVRTGGGTNHRFGLFDGILIKDNHTRMAGGVTEAIARAKAGHHLLKIEVEVRNLAEVEEALRAGVDVIMLDNMTVTEMAEAVRLIRRTREGVLVEASGNVSLDTVRGIAETGVDIISVGALTHSARAVDISMKMT
jgi:nicotinate-nucleotide pyrophosphorylase (carboxylating)